jgi:hypothetical protein
MGAGRAPISRGAAQSTSTKALHFKRVVMGYSLNNLFPLSLECQYGDQALGVTLNGCLLIRTKY